MQREGIHSAVCFKILFRVDGIGRRRAVGVKMSGNTDALRYYILKVNVCKGGKFLVDFRSKNCFRCPDIDRERAAGVYINRNTHMLV